MNSLPSWLRLCFILKIIAQFNCYVLLAADPDDFRNIAKKIVPENLADKLAQLASDITQKQSKREKGKDTDYYYETNDEYGEDETKGDNDNDYENVRDVDNLREGPYVKDWNTRVNFDELVERVKDRLAKELTEKLKKQILNPQDRNPFKSIYHNIKQENQNDKYKKAVTKDVHYDYSYDQSDPKTVKTYGYNNPSDKVYSKQDNEYTKSFGNDYEGLKKQMSLNQNTKLDYHSYDNNKELYKGDRLREQYELDENPNLEYSVRKEKQIFNKQKQISEISHEEDNSSYHSQNSKSVTYGIENIPKTEQNRGNNKYVNNNVGKYTERENYGNRNRNVPVKHNSNNYDNKFDKDIFVDKNERDDNKHPLFDEFDLSSKRKNDSYEDYVIPKVENRYASDETITKDPRNIKQNSFNYQNSRFKVQQNNFETKPSKAEKLNTQNLKQTEDYTEIEYKSQEIKAKTESLLYNDDDLGPKTIKDDNSRGNYDDLGPKTIKDDDSRGNYDNLGPKIKDHHSRDIDKVSGDATERTKAKGTMIPTREYFKMSSPNYYISLPTVVEKYDPNEPLPERDREREVIKHFVNPPASINRKVKLL